MGQLMISFRCLGAENRIGEVVVFVDENTNLQSLERYVIQEKFELLMGLPVFCHHFEIVVVQIFAVFLFENEETIVGVSVERFFDFIQIRIHLGEIETEDQMGILLRRGIFADMGPVEQKVELLFSRNIVIAFQQRQQGGLSETPGANQKQKPSGVLEFGDEMRLVHVIAIILSNSPVAGYAIGDFFHLSSFYPFCRHVFCSICNQDFRLSHSCQGNGTIFQPVAQAVVALYGDS